MSPPDWCYEGVTGCCEGVSKVLQGWNKDGTRVLQGCCNSITNENDEDDAINGAEDDRLALYSTNISGSSASNRVKREEVPTDFHW